MTSSRIELFRKEMVKNKFDAFFVSDQYNVSFLTGFKGLVAGVREAFFLITKNSTYFITFSTCSGLFKESNKHFKVLCATPFKGLTEILEDIIKNTSGSYVKRDIIKFVASIYRVWNSYESIVIKFIEQQDQDN